MTAKPKPRRRTARPRAPGAGRPRKDPVGTARTIGTALTPTQIATGERIGGTVQDGIRRLLDEAAAAGR